MRNAGGNLTFCFLFQAFSKLSDFAVPHPSFCLPFTRQAKIHLPPGGRYCACGAKQLDKLKFEPYAMEAFYGI
jgi:hypothetical protein